MIREYIAFIDDNEGGTSGITNEEIVRCKECRYYQDNNGGYPNADCKWRKDETPDANDYCSCGERRIR